ncbi:aminoglycoside phosphotransferase family protein [Umezawaea sp.]|uniref:aminoglycoside phosphotransferase family protein n=1 Tax=Umezawaea sp. TaxID=1955258 RepID=UPI002ECFBA95
MDVEEITERLTRRFGPSVADWCAGAPARAERAAAEWGLALGELITDGASSVAVRCAWPDGTPAVLKLSPEEPFLAEQVAMLRRFAPSGRVPAVLAARADAVVLEEVRPGTAADELDRHPSPELWADLVGALHAVEPPADAPRDLRDRTGESFARIGRRLAEPAIGARISRRTWDLAARRCEALLDTAAARVVLHGDLHLGNVLDGGPRGLVAIDPKVCVGDPCFDAFDYVLAGAGLDGVENRCAALAEAAGLDGDRLLTWARVGAPMLAIALIPDGAAEEAVAELLALSAPTPG